jgi:hypothetical protein
VHREAPERRIFSLEDARRLLPEVKEITAGAVREAERLAGQLQGLSDAHPEHAALSDALSAVLQDWNDAVRGLGLEPKGLWLVDFDNGDGYYCWAYPEASITHYHAYDDGFAGRMKIV